ncbi:hypothetical protein MPTK1_6g09380 [Marchantia polymorpha subsp. ruderalis]|uniref:Enoyl-CoA hydratase n=2 Tax=Marchantia polymorpha TaxID=3197 RepID=A0A176VW16_MARPO|nr:hypothetical protein AXG93_3545s1120 [Marchantia polymorpha subsp. ruderalis]PTQ28902.1 hypothetical protein MARPO_0152s0018 [Marchantia polymorpha]BBN14162.1 hypothetical protein Mp_6g09380 [Marchantia polymorpha subsp. ruderalis]|eukprot:PTQ28902.1 hypothetical protein MARPO_0152s0018 [Marchantia polymorpha]
MGGEAKKDDVREQVKLEVSANGIATVTLNRPKTMNSLSSDMIHYLAHIIKTAANDDKVKVIILTGNGRGFCAGVDLSAAKGVFQGDVKDESKDPVYQMDLCKKPIIGAVNGWAITGGFEVALACDILIASTEAKFMDTHSKFGIFPSWGMSQRLSRLIGLNCARHVHLTGMEVDSQLAEKWGLVSQVVPPAELMKTAHSIAEMILKNDENLVRDFKAIANDGGRLPLGEGLKLEKERAHASYKAMTPEFFAKLQQYISGRKQTPSKL